MRYHVQHDDEVWCDDLCLFTSETEAAATAFVALANSAFEKIERHRPHFLPTPIENNSPNEELRRIEAQLQAWLTDNTDEDFAEVPEIDGARLLILEYIGEAPK